MKNNLIVIGGGPAGLFSAITAAKNNNDVILIEKNSECAKKLLITGKGRCNVTNFCDVNELIENVNVNKNFMYSAFNAFNSYDTFDYFTSLGVNLKIERGNRVFPETDKAQTIKDALVNDAKKQGVKIINDKVTSVFKKDKFFIKCENGTYQSDKLIIATGGASYPKTGSTGDGYKFAKSFGHKIINPKPSLVGLRDDGKCKDIMGLSLKNVGLKIFDGQKLLYSDFGEMLFTHKGISGPMVLSASAHLDNKNYTALIDLKPALDEKVLDDRILRDLSENLNKDFQNSLSKLLPKKIILSVILQSGINPREKVNSITKAQRKNLLNAIKNFKVNIVGKESINEAIITSGGVDVKQIDPKTMKSKLVDGLFFAGEIIDVDAYTGGFNLQIAFSTAFVAGNNI